MADQVEMKRQLSAVAKSSLESLITAAESLAREKGNHLQLGRGDLEQMVAGFLAVISEGLEGEGTPIRSQFIDAIYPSLIAAGEQPHRLLALASKFHFLAACHLAIAMPPPLAGDAIEWMATFLGGYTADIARVINETAR